MKRETLSTNVLILILLLLELASMATSFKILALFLTPFYSHFIPVIPILEELLNRGHQLVIISPYDFKIDPQWGQRIQVIQLSELQLVGQEFTKQMDFSNTLSLRQPLKYQKLFNEMFMLKVKALRDRAWNIMTQSNYDAIFVEDMGGTYFYKLSDYLNCSYIGFSPQDQARHLNLGDALHLILHPLNDESATAFEFDGPKSFYQRMMCLFYTIIQAFYYFPQDSKAWLEIDNALYGEELQDFIIERTRPDLQLKAVHAALGFHRPVLSHSVQIGFPHIRSPKPLTDDLERILTSSKNGVIYVSFGSIINTETLKKPGLFDVETFKSALSRLPYDVVWKWDSLEMDNKPSNVRLIKWAPQQDMIAHEKVKLVICHGGLQTIAEAIYFEKPLLTIPFIWDHDPNGQRVERLGIGKMIRRGDMDERELVSAVNDLINNQSYKNALQELSYVIKDKIMSPVDIAVANIDSTIRQHKMGYEIPFHAKSFIPGLEPAHLEILFAILTPFIILFASLILVFVGFKVQ